MTVAVVTLAIAIAVALGAVAVLVRALLSGLKSERASFAAEILAGKAQVAAELAQRFAERTRDEALAAQTKAELERDAANEQLTRTQQALTKAREDNAHAAVVKIRNAPSVVDALGELDQLFAIVPEGTGASVPVVPAGDDRGDAEAPAVSAAEVASEAGTRRHP